ncbi:hypothetical protein BASA81_001139 [Batrachochytrium salamandrivorans]|nr:hypothetical protein BASA81_001139 [Batrachochytrium salamandrivorans]
MASSNQFKVLTIGDSGVGKSSIIHRFANDDFSDSSLPTVGIDYKIKALQVPNRSPDSGSHSVKLSLWDTAGQERFRTITKSYFRGSHGMLLVYDVTDRTSFANCQEWIRCVEESEGQDCIVFLVANKMDHPGKHEVTDDEGVALADDFGVQFFKTSAKRDVGITQLFCELTKQMEIKQELLAKRRLSTGSASAKSSSSTPVVLRPKQQLTDAGTNKTACC